MTESRPIATVRLLALGGIAGPVLFVGAVIAGAALRPDYGHYAQFISELGETGSRSAPVMNFAGFVPAGLLILVASIAFWMRFGGAVTGALGSALVTAFGAGIFASGLFACDFGCTPDVPTTSQRLHDVAGAITFPSFILAPLFLGFRFRQLDRWRAMFPYSVATSAFAFVVAVLFVQSVDERAATGLFQRAIVGAAFLWLAVVCWRIWSSDRATA